MSANIESIVYLAPQSPPVNVDELLYEDWCLILFSLWGYMLHSNVDIYYLRLPSDSKAHHLKVL